MILGFYRHEQEPSQNCFSCYGFDKDKALVLYVYKVRQVITISLLFLKITRYLAA